VLAACTALALTLGCAAAAPPPGPSPEVVQARVAAERAAREASGFVGIYRAREAGLATTLRVRSDGTAELASVRLGRGVERRPGRWGVSGGQLRIEWDPVDGSGAAPAPLTWLRAEDGTLVPATSDPAAAATGGATGPLLARWEPSRAPAAGCAWEPLADAALGLRLLVEACGANGPRFAVRGAEIVAVSNESGGARGIPIVQVFAKDPKQPLAEAIRARFFPLLVPRVRKGCVVRKGGGPALGDPAKQTWTIAPTEKYRGETEKWRAAEPTAMVCGPYGERDGIGYFEFHPKASPGRYLFVWLGRETPRFDERSIELLD